MRGRTRRRQRAIRYLKEIALDYAFLLQELGSE